MDEHNEESHQYSVGGGGNNEDGAKRSSLNRSHSSAAFSLAGNLEQRPTQNSQCESSQLANKPPQTPPRLDRKQQHSVDRTKPPPFVRQPNSNWSKLLVSQAAVADINKQKLKQRYYGMMSNEQLLDGFMLLRLMQFINFDIHYIGLKSPAPRAAAVSPEPIKPNKPKDPHRHHLSDKKHSTEPPAPTVSGLDLEANLDNYVNVPMNKRAAAAIAYEPPPDQSVSIMNELEQMNPLGHFLESRFVAPIYKYLKIFFSMVALLISLDKSLSTMLLCLLAKIDSKSPGVGLNTPSMGLTNEASDISMSWFVLILVNLSSTYIIFSTIFNGHLLWQLMSQRLFLVSRRFQYRVMLSLLVFVYLEYVINISFINNLFGWSFEKSDLEHTIDYSQLAEKQHNDHENIHNAYSVLNNLKKFVTEQDDEHRLNDIVLTVMQFARGIIRISPYITINYVIICLNEHIKTIRNQNLLTDSLKRRQKLRLVVKNRRANLRASTNSRSRQSTTGTGNNNSENRRKRVIFVTESSGGAQNGLQNGLQNDLRPPLSPLQLQPASSPTPSSSSSTLVNNYYSRASNSRGPTNSLSGRSASNLSESRSNLKLDDSSTDEQNKAASADYLSRIKDFDELECYVTNLYIFTGRLNRLMSRQGLAMFFIVHNLVITCALIVPEAIRGGPPMVVFVRLLVIAIAIVPFLCGQSLNRQLYQLSKQIDRIIIQQQFTSRRRDNLVRIRELLHDIRVNCGGMLNFNVETGIKYLAVSFASAFFIEQEDYKLTRRH